MATGAERQKKHRERRKAGVRMLRVWVHELDASDAVVGAGVLDAWDADDWKKVEAAFESLEVLFGGESVTRNASLAGVVAWLAKNRSRP